MGTLALAFGSDACRSENARAGELSAAGLPDFDSRLLEGLPPATVEQVLALRTDRWAAGSAHRAAVSSEVRVASRELLSLDDDRMVIATDLEVSITRAGLFQLSFVLPAGLDVETLTGPGPQPMDGNLGRRSATRDAAPT